VTDWTPAELTSADMLLWLDGLDANTMFDAVSGGAAVALDGAIARWQDKSGNLNHATQSTVLSRPLRVAGGVRFDGSNDSLTLGSPLTATDYVFFGVVHKRASGNAMFILAAGTGGSGGYSYADFSDGGVYFTNSTAFFVATGAGNNLNKVIVANSTTLYRNGVFTAVTTGSSTGTLVNIVGARPGSSHFANADFCELIWGPVARLNRHAVVIEGYLAHRHGLASSLPVEHPFKTTAPTIGGTSGTVGLTGLSGVGRLGT
jgi:hypothetical protein